MASRRLTDLHPDFQPRAQQLVAAWKAACLDVLVTCTLRSLEEQAALYAQGRTAPGNIVTKARPGSSWHNWGLALDAVPLLSGKPAWDVRAFRAIWERFGAVVRECGLSWGGDWTTLPDFPHVEYHPGLTLAHARELGPKGVSALRLT